MENLPVDYFTTTSAYTPHVFRDQYPSIDPSQPALSQTGKVVVITGATAGIGALGLSPAFAKAGPKAVVLVARNQAKLEALAKELQAKYPAVEFLPVSASVSDEAQVSKLYEVVKQKYGHADVLINNAGVWAQQAMFAEATPSKWWSDFEVNVNGPFLMSQGFVRLLGPEKEGTIVTLNTGIAGMVAPSMSSYSISKSASLRLAEYIAAEHPNVNSVSIQPGVVNTEMVVDSFKRFALDTPELVGGSVVWLSTDAARFLSGRFVSANWSVNDLMKQKEKIMAGNDLKLVYQGTFGLDQFSEEEKK